MNYKKVAGLFFLAISVVGMWGCEDNNTSSTTEDSAATTTEEPATTATGDKTAPVITLKGDNPLTLQAGESYNEPGATAVDDTDGSVTVNVVTNLADELNTGINKNRLGTYHVTYTAEDKAGNQSSVKRTVYVRVSPDKKINDTGVDWGAATLSTSNTNCQGMSIAEQDCSFGRDKQAKNNTLSKAGSGAAGFDFSKLGQDGKPLTIQDQAYDENGNEAAGTKWSCVKDNTTGLVWEVKRNVTQAADLHGKEDYFSWYNTDTTSNGGQSGNVLGDNIGQCFGMTQQSQTDTTTFCNTQAFIARVNNEKLCGFADWRLPSKEELASIIHYGASTEPLIDQNFFPNTGAQTIPGSPYWTSDPLAVDDNYNLAWLISFTSDSQSTYSAGETLYGNDSANVGYIRLVRK